MICPRYNPLPFIYLFSQFEHLEKREVTIQIQNGKKHSGFHNFVTS